MDEKLKKFEDLLERWWGIFQTETSGIKTEIWRNDEKRRGDIGVLHAKIDNKFEDLAAKIDSLADKFDNRMSPMEKFQARWAGVIATIVIIFTGGLWLVIEVVDSRSAERARRDLIEIKKEAISPRELRKMKENGDLNITEEV